MKPEKNVKMIIYQNHHHHYHHLYHHHNQGSKHTPEKDEDEASW